MNSKLNAENIGKESFYGFMTFQEGTHNSPFIILSPRAERWRKIVD